MFDFVLRPFKRNFGRDKEYYRKIDDMFGFMPHNIELYKLALINKSACITVDGQSINNERLEFLGDAVIESVTSDYLYIEYPDYDEGLLTQMRSKIVSRQSLNALAEQMGLDKCIICGRSGGAIQKHVFGDAFEAMMGAIYLDQGYNFVNRLLINRIYAKHLSLDELSESETDFKSRLIEWGQKHHRKVAFSLSSKSRSNGVKQFRATVLVDGLAIGHGFGSTKKEAEQNAARSLSQEISEDAYIRLLDKLDKLDSQSGTVAPAQIVSGDEQTTSTESGRRRRRRRRKKEGTAGDVAGDASGVEPTPGVSEQEAEPDITPDIHTVEEPVAETVAAESSSAGDIAAEGEAAPKKRRGRRKKSDAAEELPQTGAAENQENTNGEDASAQNAGTADTAVEGETAPKKRRGRRKKTDAAEPTSQTEAADNQDNAGEMPARAGDTAAEAETKPKRRRAAANSAAAKPAEEKSADKKPVKAKSPAAKTAGRSAAGRRRKSVAAAETGESTEGAVAAPVPASEAESA